MTRLVAFPARRVAAALLVLLCAVPVAGAFAETPQETARKATTVLEQMMQAPDHAMALDMLRNAYAVAVMPSVLRAGLVIGGRHGQGLLSVKRESGWSAPSFITIAGGSLGVQVGVSSTDVLLIFRSKAGVESLRHGQFLLGTDLAVAAGPVGRNAHAGTNASFEAEIYAWSRSRGLFAGFSLQGASLKIDHDSNQQVYGGEVSTAALLDGEVEQLPPEMKAFRMQLTEYTGR